MFDRDDLRAAVSADILTPEQAARLEAFLLSRHAVEGDGGEEQLRFLSNFNDIFVTIGIGILFVGIAAFSGLMFGSNAASSRELTGVFFAAPIILAAWLMMEYFCARRRMLLPSMALSVIFVGAATIAAMSIVALVIGDDWFDGNSVFERAGLAGVLTFASAVGAALIVYARYRLPFSLFLAALAASGMVYAGFAMMGEFGNILGGGVSLLMGIATMAAAIWFDMQDPERIRKASDNAFWLHLAAAPQLIAGVSAVFTGSNVLFGMAGGDGADQSLILLVTLIALGVLALGLNRRALIAASLFTFIWTLVAVLGAAGMDGLSVFMLVTLLIGGGVVFLGAGWKTARRSVLSVLPRGGVWDRVFPPEPV
ncbi:MAG: hypothetical protein AAF613_06970 [Pseudomonadota bacterium]